MGYEHSQFMDLALIEAQKARARGEVPVGAVMVSHKTGEVLAQVGNRVIELRDPTAHAEMFAIKKATLKLDNERLGDCDLYVTLEPCPMCAGAISFAKIRRLYYGAEDIKGGGVDNGARVFGATSCHHKPEVYAGIGETRSAEMLQDFFKSRR